MKSVYKIILYIVYLFSIKFIEKNYQKFGNMKISPLICAIITNQQYF